MKIFLEMSQGVIPAEAGIQAYKKQLNSWIPDQVRHDGKQTRRLFQGYYRTQSPRPLPTVTDKA